MSNGLNVYGSHILGDAVAGDKLVHEAVLTPLEQVVKQIITTYDGTEELLDVIDELAGYITDRPDREIIGLEAKLQQGDRSDLLQNAVYLKSKFERKIMKQQLSLVAQKVYIHVLAQIITAFNQRIRPLIMEGKEKSAIDGVIDAEVIQPIYRAITRFDDMATAQEVCGMLYFLTGKCHLVWKK